MSKALIIIDYVYDFVADDGRLTCGKVAQDLENYISNLVNEFDKNGDFIAVATDNHSETDIYNKEKDMFPLHCFDEKGKAIYGKVGETLENVNKEKLINISKNRYSAFFGTPLDLKLKERNVTEIHLVGVCTDICVLHTSVDAYNLGYKIVVHKQGVASFNEQGHEYCLSHFKNTLSAEVV